jgi:hypothetical protein
VVTVAAESRMFNHACEFTATFLAVIAVREEATLYVDATEADSTVTCGTSHIEQIFSFGEAEYCGVMLSAGASPTHYASWG